MLQNVCFKLRLVRYIEANSWEEVEVAKPPKYVLNNKSQKLLKQ